MNSTSETIVEIPKREYNHITVQQNAKEMASNEKIKLLEAAYNESVNAEKKAREKIRILEEKIKSMEQKNETSIRILKNEIKIKDEAIEEMRDKCINGIMIVHNHYKQLEKSKEGLESNNQKLFSELLEAHTKLCTKEKKETQSKQKGGGLIMEKINEIINSMKQ